MTDQSSLAATAKAPGLVLHNAAIYDFIVWLLTRGRERGFRQKLLQLASLRPGEAVLDVGCGTGSLAIAAKRQVGPSGLVCGVDPSPEMLGRAARKARHAACDVRFTPGAAQALPYPDAAFDVAMSTVMLHHLPRKGREECLAEIKRVLKPGGRVLVVDFGAAEPTGHFLGRFHRHGHVKFADMVALIERAGFDIRASGPVGFRELQFALAVAP